MFFLAATARDPADAVILLIAVVVAAAVGHALARRGVRSPASQPPPNADQNARAVNAQAMRTHGERETKAFEQHTELNSLAAQKFKREVELLDIQLQLAKFDLGMRHDSRDYHDLMMEKARHEIESLKEHIKEQKKRNEDFGSHDEH